MKHFNAGIMAALAMGSFTGCAVEDMDELDLGEHEQASMAYYPMGFARVTSAGGLVTRFNKTGGAVTVARTLGNYVVTFAGLGVTGSLDSSGGHVQITAEGTNNVRCHLVATSGAPNVSITVACSGANGLRADSAFAVQYVRYTMPTATSTYPTVAAYSRVRGDGFVAPLYDYNSSGTHNRVARTAAGRYTVTITNASYVNASMMVTPVSTLATSNMCSIAGWGSGTAAIECRDRNGNLADSGFSFSYSTSGPSLEQQGAHAWFNGTVASPSYSAALGKYGCSAANVTGSRAGSLVTMTVTGDLGSWDTTPFLRASFASKYGTAGYCKVETATSAGVAPTSTGTATVRCYSPTGAVVATPQLTYTQVTSDASGPC